jgi:hypothetical protein
MVFFKIRVEETVNSMEQKARAFCQTDAQEHKPSGYKYFKLNIICGMYTICLWLH